MAIHQSEAQVQVNHDGSIVWVHANDGSTVGRFSKRFGIDVHTTATQQLEGSPQCLHCTHSPGTASDWELFCDPLNAHHLITVPKSLIKFP